MLLAAAATVHAACCCGQHPRCCYCCQRPCCCCFHHPASTLLLLLSSGVHAVAAAIVHRPLSVAQASTSRFNLSPPEFAALPLPVPTLPNWHQEVTKLKGKVELLQRSQRHLLGEDLGPLNVKELQHLERQLEVALTHLRTRKTQVMLDQIEELRQRERLLHEVNKSLQKKLSETEGRDVISGIEQTSNTNTGTNGPWDSSITNTAYALSHPQQNSNSSLHHVDCEPTLQIGYQPVAPESIGPPHQPPHNNQTHNQYMQGCLWSSISWFFLEDFSSAKIFLRVVPKPHRYQPASLHRKILWTWFSFKICGNATARPFNDLTASVQQRSSMTSW